MYTLNSNLCVTLNQEETELLLAGIAYAINNKKDNGNQLAMMYAEMYNQAKSMYPDFILFKFKDQ